MLPKRHRLTRSSDFSRVRRFGRSSGNQFLVLYVVPARTDEIHVGFSVSKRVGKATVRNRVKRRMREVVRLHLSYVRPGMDLVFIARPASAGASYQQIAKTIVQLLHKMGAMQQLVGSA